MQNINQSHSSLDGETGRSMVEMLGVLAIIGVLSIGGIAGYTTAMNKYKANEILNAASVRAMVVSTQIQTGSSSPTLVEFTDNKVGGATFGTEVKNTAGTGAWTKGTDQRFSLTLSDVDSNICDQMNKIVPSNSENPSITCNAEVKTAVLTYNTDLVDGSVVSGPVDDGTCALGCLPEQFCKNKECLCPEGTYFAASEGCIPCPNDPDDIPSMEAYCKCTFEKPAADSTNGKCYDSWDEACGGPDSEYYCPCISTHIPPYTQRNFNCYGTCYEREEDAIECRKNTPHLDDETGCWNTEEKCPDSPNPSCHWYNGECSNTAWFNPEGGCAYTKDLCGVDPSNQYCVWNGIACVWED